jgi:hypothetical protein
MALEEPKFLEIQSDYQKLQRKLEEVRKLQVDCKKKILTAYKAIPNQDSASRLKRSYGDKHCGTNDAYQLVDKLRELQDMEATLPRQNHWFLRLTLGELDVTLLTKTDRYLYKQQYEDFKMVVTIVIGVFSLANLMIYQQYVLNGTFYCSVYGECYIC